MLWLNPAALFALAVAAAPILIHLLIQRRAERFPFPTLRFLQPTRLAAIRRHLLEDVPLLAVRVALLAAAVAALAGPLLITAARRQAWDRRIVRAVVTDEGARGFPLDGARGRQASDRTDRSVERAAPHQEKTFAGASLPDGIRRAMLWLDTAPPARREIVVASPFPIGSITQADVAAVPAHVGVRFERTGALPATRTVPAGRLLTPDGVRAREVTFAGDRTSVREAGGGDPMGWPIDVVSSTAERPAADAAIAAVLSQRVWAGPADRRARLVLIDSNLTANVAQAIGGGAAQAFRPATIDQPWMAGAVSRIASDRDLREAAARVGAGLPDALLAAPPWQTLASAADGRPLAAAAAGPANVLVVTSAAPASDVVTPVLLRSITNAIGTVPDLRFAEVVPIADAVLQRWSRPAAPMPSTRIETVGQDDRRWLWVAVLCLLALETWIRRARPADASPARLEEDARVA